MIRFSKKWALWHLALHYLKITPARKVSRKSVAGLNPSTKARGQIAVPPPALPLVLAGRKRSPWSSPCSVQGLLTPAFHCPAPRTQYSSACGNQTLCSSRWAKSCLSPSLEPPGVLSRWNKQDLALGLLPGVSPLALSVNGGMISAFIWCGWSWVRGPHCPCAWAI